MNPDADGNLPSGTGPHAEPARHMTAAGFDAMDRRNIHTRLADIDAHSAPARAAQILSGLGFSEETQNGPCSALSGGWRMRVALAAALFAAPDLLKHVRAKS